jgi:hypothetical protein
MSRAVILGDDFEEFSGIVAFADALDGLIDGFAFVVAGEQDADCGMPGVILLNVCFRERKLQD